MVSRAYNGFSPSQRAEGGRLQTQAFRRGLAVKPTVCLACGHTGPDVIAHLEDYSRPIEAIMGLCPACHRAVHVRDVNPHVFRLRRKAIMEGRLPHQNGVIPKVDLFGEIASGKYVPPPEAVQAAPEYQGKWQGYWTKAAPAPTNPPRQGSLF